VPAAAGQLPTTLKPASVLSMTISAPLPSASARRR
jgi:hypothetical protein